MNTNHLVNSVTFPATIQTLDRRVGDKKLNFVKEQFAKSVNDWDGIPLIFHPRGQHPRDFKAIAENAVEAAKQMGGRVVGVIHNPHIVTEGHPHLDATLEINSYEKEIIDLYKKGKLSFSSAFTANADGDKIVSPPIPNHGLLFEEVLDKVTPGDPGSFVHTAAFVNTIDVSQNTDYAHPQISHETVGDLSAVQQIENVQDTSANKIMCSEDGTPLITVGDLSKPVRRT